MTKGRKLALWGAWLQLGPVFGLLGTVVAMISAFDEVSKTGNPASPEALSDAISLALSTTAIGIIPALVGVILLCVALFSSKYRAPWFFWFMTIFAVFSLLGIPIGTVLGVIILVYILPRKAEFECQSAVTGQTDNSPSEL